VGREGDNSKDSLQKRMLNKARPVNKQSQRSANIVEYLFIFSMRAVFKQLYFSYERIFLSQVLIRNFFLKTERQEF